MAEVSQSVCLNHPNQPAVARCTSCRKPVCAACVVKQDGKDYCSTQCAQNAVRGEASVDHVIKAKEQGDAARNLRKLITLLILLALCAIAYYVYKQKKEEVGAFIQKTQNTVDKAASGAKSAIQQKVPTDSKYKRDREDSVK